MTKKVPPENIRLKSNSPADLQKEDLFNTLPKAKAIQDFIKSNPDSLIDNRMLVLYGEWGSGKTSILRFIENEINDDYETVFFEAWQHEKDDNLPFSLLDAIYEKVKNKNKLKGAFQSLYTVMKSFAKSTKFNLGIVSIESDKLIEGIEKQEMEREISLYKKNRQFYENFEKIEKSILERSSKKKLLVFIDDLDRCEPEKVLDLLAAIKLFFSYGQNTIYFCALDKEATTKAVKLKYSDVIKSDEYLEKVFDISFTMPTCSEINKLLRYYFDQNKYANESITNDQVIDKLSQFFNSINFTNPRHLKKILNKYLMVEYFKTKQIESHILIPEIILNEGGSVINIIFVLVFIILYEFYPSKFYEIEQYDIKINNYATIHYHYMISTKTRASANFTFVNAKDNIQKNLAIPDIMKYSFRDLSRNYDKEIFHFINIFTPNAKETLEIKGGSFNEHDYLNQFDSPDNKILINFAKYLLGGIKKELETHDYDYNIFNLFEMAKTVL